MRFIYSIHVIQVFSFVCVLTWSLLGVKKAWPTPRSVSLRGLIQNFRRASPPHSDAQSPPPRGWKLSDGAESFVFNWQNVKIGMFLLVNRIKMLGMLWALCTARSRKTWHKGVWRFSSLFHSVKYSLNEILPMYWTLYYGQKRCFVLSSAGLDKE